MIPVSCFATASAAAADSLGRQLPLWSMAPFVAMLLAVAALPMLVPHWWESNRHRALVAATLGMPVVVAMATLDPHRVVHTAWEYAAFIILLGSLYVIASGVVLRGTLPCTPAANALLLLLGALLASLIGTTGASMLLVRPLLRANARRQRRAHSVVFFIFLVSNVGGLLTPLGDPPLFLGFLRGVPFAWTLRLWPQWAFAVGCLLLAYYALDSWHYRQEPTAQRNPKSVTQTPLHLAGAGNLLAFAALIGLILLSGSGRLPAGAQEAGMLAIAALAWRLTPAQRRSENHFSWAPMVEVTVIFAGIFATMMPALVLLNTHGGALGLHTPAQFFWVTGLLSSMLDNAPTYLTFTSAASSLLGTDAAHLRELLATDAGPRLLTGISVGAVMMGANTYIGNGPNLMVKAVAENADVPMPSFLGYMVYAAAFLLPIFGLMHLLFF